MLTIEKCLPRYNANPTVIISDSPKEYEQSNYEYAHEIHAPAEIQVVQSLIKPFFRCLVVDMRVRGGDDEHPPESREMVKTNQTQSTHGLAFHMLTNFLGIMYIPSTRYINQKCSGCAPNM